MRREFFPYLGFSQMWPKISERLIHQSPWQLKATKPMTSGNSRICKKKKPTQSGLFLNYPGGDLLSHTVPRVVPLALKGLTAVFGKGTGVTPSL